MLPSPLITVYSPHRELLNRTTPFHWSRLYNSFPLNTECHEEKFLLWPARLWPSSWFWSHLPPIAACSLHTGQPHCAMSTPFHSFTNSAGQLLIQDTWINVPFVCNTSLSNICMIPVFTLLMSLLRCHLCREVSPDYRTWPHPHSFSMPLPDTLLLCLHLLIAHCLPRRQPGDVKPENTSLNSKNISSVLLYFYNLK